MALGERFLIKSLDSMSCGPDDLDDLSDAIIKLLFVCCNKQ